MTRQMADDEVLRVLELAMMRNIHRDDSPPPEELAHWRAALAAVAALQAERDALRRDVDKYRVPWQEYDERTEWVQRTAKPKELGMHRADVLRLRIEHAEQRAERAESALEALRGQVAELMKFREGGLPTKGWLRDNDQSRRVLHELNELLAMKNSGEF